MSSTFRALRHRNYRLWFIGQGISLIGSWMQTMAQQVLIYRLTGSATALGLMSLLGLIPLLPLALWGGSLSDRMPKRTVILVCQVLLMLQAVGLAVVVWTGVVQVWQVYVFSLFLAAVQAVDLPARQAFTVDLVEGKADLTNAIGLNSAMFNGARAIGPAAAGLLVAATGEGTAFFINGLTFIPVIISLLMMRNLPQSHRKVESREVRGHMVEGFKFLSRQQTLLVLISLVGVSAFLSMPYNTLMPVFAEKVLFQSAQPVIGAICGVMTCRNPEALPLGMLLTMMGVGATVGALAVASLPDRARRGIMLTIGNLGFPAALILLAVSRSFGFSLLVMLMIGVSFTWQNALANTLLQLNTPDEMRGRVMSFYSLSFPSMMRLGGMQAGLVADWLSAPLSVGIGAGLSLLYGLFVAIRYPRVRQLS